MMPVYYPSMLRIYRPNVLTTLKNSFAAFFKISFKLGKAGKMKRFERFFLVWRVERFDQQSSLEICPEQNNVENWLSYPKYPEIYFLKISEIRNFKFFLCQILKLTSGFLSETVQVIERFREQLRTINTIVSVLSICLHASRHYILEVLV